MYCCLETLHSALGCNRDVLIQKPVTLELSRVGGTIRLGPVTITLGPVTITLGPVTIRLGPVTIRLGPDPDPNSNSLGLSW